MILQALTEYYDRKAADPERGIAPEGWEYKAIQYVFVINGNGNLIQIEDTREREGKRIAAKIFLVPRSETKTSNIKANLLWDKAEYIFSGIDSNKDKNRLEQQRAKFISRLKNQLGEFECIQILVSFLEKEQSERLTQEYCWDDIKKGNPYITFRFEGESNLLVQRQEIINKINTFNFSKAGQDDKEVCLITGDLGIIKRIHSKTPINKKNNSLVSFQKNSGYDSYGKEQGLNAPISQSSEFAYVTALNTLLKSQRQKFIIGDATYVCWSSEKTKFETDFYRFFDDPDTKDNPDQFSENVKVLFNSINTGAFIQSEGSQYFYILGLSPGGGTRISVRFWDCKNISEYAKNIRQYFDDLSIQKPPGYPEYYSIWRLLESVAQQGDREKISPRLAGEMVRSIICGLPYPENLLQAALQRTRSGIKKRVKGGGVSIEKVTPEIAALIKAYLNRFYRFYPSDNYKEVNIELDINQQSVGYQLGRLFATLEQIQIKANPKINTTIRERFYGAACATPVTVFTTLLRLKNYHLAKLDKGKVIFFEQILGEIIGNFNDFPSYLNLHEQGLFAIGYYHQRQAFFTPKKTDYK